jgi:hypothetical protein
MGRRPSLDSEHSAAAIQGSTWWAETERWRIAVHVIAGAALGLAVGMSCDLMPGVPELLSLTFRLVVTTAVWTGPGLAEVRTDRLIFVATNGA